MDYVYRVRPELVWAVLQAAAAPVVVALAAFDPEVISDWRLWAITIGAASVRGVGAALLAAMGSNGKVVGS